MKKHFTIGMSGHIDHGKTTLTKALTNVDTDTLKEEKERQISIELGFAPLLQNDELNISVIDVPGHERFIKRMIAGVSGIDLVLLVVAADEGVMPQTKEHLEILDFLGVKGGIVVITKCSTVDDEFLEIVKEEISLELEHTIFKDSPIFMVDSVTTQGIAELKEAIITSLQQIRPRDYKGAFRLPIDSVFTIKGQGTVVRGTVNEGSIVEGDTLWILPSERETKARQIQVHHQKASSAVAGQRTAINLANISRDEVQRGDVLVSSQHFVVTDTIDVSLRMVEDLEYIVKQRMPITCYIGTTEVMGRIVFFDRNELEEENEEILCQLRLEEKVVTKRGDAFILRRPSPQETIGGGWVIDPNGKKYRFGLKTIEVLHEKKEGSPEDRVLQVLLQHTTLNFDEIITFSSLHNEEVEAIIHNSNAIVEFAKNAFSHQRIVEDIKEDLFDKMLMYQNEHSMRKGIQKAEIIQELSNLFPKKLVEYCLAQGENSLWKSEDMYVSTMDFVPHVPKNWAKRVENSLNKLHSDGLEVRYLENYFEDQGIPVHMMKEIMYFLVTKNEIISLDQQYYVSSANFRQAVEQLKCKTEQSFSVTQAKDILGLSRKYMIPFLERLDAEKLTQRKESERVWI